MLFSCSVRTSFVSVVFEGMFCALEYKIETSDREHKICASYSNCYDLLILDTYTGTGVWCFLLLLSLLLVSFSMS